MPSAKGSSAVFWRVQPSKATWDCHSGISDLLENIWHSLGLNQLQNGKSSTSEMSLNVYKYLKIKSNYRRRRAKVKSTFFLRLQSQDLGVFEVILQGRKEKAEAYCDLNKAKELGTCDQRVE